MEMKKFVECLSESEKMELLELLTKNSNESKSSDWISFNGNGSVGDRLEMIGKYLEVYSSENEFGKNFASSFERYKVRILNDCSRGVNFYVSFMKHFKTRLQAMVKKDNENNILTWMGFEERKIITGGEKDIPEEAFELYNMYAISEEENRKGCVHEVEYHPYVLDKENYIYFEGLASIE